MKSRIQKWMAALVFCLAVCAASGVSGVSASAVSAQTRGGSADVYAASKTAKKNGWVTTKAGRKRYYKNGKYVTKFCNINGKTYYFTKTNGFLMKDTWIRLNGKKYRANKAGQIVKNKLKTIDGKAYYFNASGAVYKGWKTFKSGKSYFVKNGGARAQGLTNIGGKYYYFDKKGILRTGTFTVGNTVYYMDGNGVMIVRKEKDQYYDSKNKKMTQAASWDFEATQNAKKVVSQITTPGMSQSQKLKKCFDWVISKYYFTRRSFSNFDGWPAVFANDHFLYGNGNCHSDASAFAYLAKALGYTNVYVCTDARGGSAAHSWTEINGLAYDPLFAEAKSYYGNYGVRYGVYKLSPILHIKIA